MKNLLVFLTLAGFLFACNSKPGSGGSSGATLSNQIDSASYGLGMLVATNFKDQGVTDLNFALVKKAMEDVMAGVTAPLKPEDAQAVIQKMMMAATEKASEAGKLAGVKFLEENKKKSGVTTTASGLQYEVMKQGAGSKPSGPTANVKVHYHGTLIDGTVFDSSVERGEPIGFALNGVIPGWTEGVQLMNVGSKYKFYVPQELAYGANAPPGSPIKPYSALIFEVELLEVK